MLLDQEEDALSKCYDTFNNSGASSFRSLSKYIQTQLSVKLTRRYKEDAKQWQLNISIFRLHGLILVILHMLFTHYAVQYQSQNQNQNFLMEDSVKITHIGQSSSSAS